MVDTAPEHQYFLYHQFGSWINDDTSAGTAVEHPSAHSPFFGTDAAEARALWHNADSRAGLVGGPEIVQSNSFQVVPTGAAKLVFVIYDISFWIYPEFTTEANRLNCQYGVLEALRAADGLLFISESGRKEFEHVFPGLLEANGKQAAAIPLASRLAPPDKTETMGTSERFWLAVGSMEPRKNYDTMFSALDLYWEKSERPAPLWIAAGAGWKNEKIKARAQALEANGRIRMLGYIDERHLATLYQDSLGLLFPTWYEGFGLPVLEAMQSGCPVICSDRTSLPEVGGDAPIYINPADAQSICDAMISLEEDEELRLRCRAAGLNRAKQFSWSRTARETLEFYRRVIDS